MRSLSTSALGQPSETKEMRGAGRRSVWAMSVTPVDCHGRAAEARNSSSRAIGGSLWPGQARMTPAVARSVLAPIPDGVPLLFSRPDQIGTLKQEARIRARFVRERGPTRPDWAQQNCVPLFFNSEFRHSLKLEFLGQTDRLVAIVAKYGHGAHAQTPLRF